MLGASSTMLLRGQVMIQALCPTCGTTVKAPDEMAGKTVSCSGCGMPVSVGGGGLGAGGLEGAGMGGLGGYGGYCAAQQPAQRSKSSDGPLFLKWYVLV